MAGLAYANIDADGPVLAEAVWGRMLVIGSAMSRVDPMRSLDFVKTGHLPAAKRSLIPISNCKQKLMTIFTNSANRAEKNNAPVRVSKSSNEKWRNMHYD